MEPAVTAVIAFTSALLGAVAGFLGAVYIESWRIRRTRRGIVRALLGELRQNAGAVILTRFSGKPPVVKFSSQTWRAANFELAQFLSEKLYSDILFIYDMLPAMEDFCSHPARIAATETALDEWVERVKKARSELLKLPEAAKFRPEEAEPLTPPEQTGEKIESEEGNPPDKAGQGK